MRSLPLANLGTFVVAAKHLSFTKAADEVHLTQGAVSQQIRHLEDKLGFELFIRHHKRLELTSAGARLAMQLDHSFTELRCLIKELKDEQSSDILTLSVMPSFATKWLIPRLGNLQNAYPELQLRIQANDGEVNFRRDRVDVAIVHSLVHKGEGQTTALLKDDVFPVCSPGFLEANKLTTPDDLARVSLLNDDSEWRFASPYAEWDSWLSLAQAKGVIASRGISFNRGDLAVQAAIAGQGIALGRTPLVMDDIKAGRLVRPFDTTLDAGNAYYFVCPESNSKRESVKSLLRWLVNECFLYAPEASLTIPEEG